jgi:hypothetical protein
VKKILLVRYTIIGITNDPTMGGNNMPFECTHDKNDVVLAT